jgi:hypothetical protein
MELKEIVLKAEESGKSEGSGRIEVEAGDRRALEKRDRRGNVRRKDAADRRDSEGGDGWQCRGSVWWGLCRNTGKCHRSLEREGKRERIDGRIVKRLEK